MATDTKEIKRVYNIPLRKEWLKAPMYRRSKKAITAVREFLTRHMKSENIKLGKELNFKIWERGIKKPPHHILVNVTKTTAGVVEAELAGFDYHSKPVEPKTKNTKKETKNDVKKTETAKEKLEEKLEKAKPAVKKGKKPLEKDLDAQKE